ncbi:MAG: hypothetical protein ACREQ9_00085 [Candidatus Binatia bacterium]
MGSRALRLLVPLAMLAGPVPAATLLPLDAEDAALLPPGVLELIVGAEGLYGFQPPFRDVERDQWSAPVVAVNAGLGERAEAQFRWEALAVDDEPTSQEPAYFRYDAGDARLFTKIRVLAPGDFGVERLPATALHFGMKLPNASFRKRIGTDEADFFGGGLLSTEFLGARLHANLGMAILGNPGLTRGQDDHFLYRFAAEAPGPFEALRFFAEVSGSEGSRFENDRHGGRLGARLGGERLAGYVGASAAFDELGEDFGVRFGLVYRLRAYSP